MTKTCKMNQCRYDSFMEVVYIDPPLVDALKNKKDPLHDKIQDAINLFHWQRKDDKYRITLDPFDEITYHFHRWGLDTVNDTNYVFSEIRSMYNRCYCIFENDDQFHEAMQLVKRIAPYTWAWKYDNDHPGYEVTSKGDRRYSPFFQRVKDYNDPSKLITAEEYFLKYIKSYRDKGLDPPIRGHQLMNDYMKDHRGLLFELAIIGRSGNFTDMFDKDGGQNKWYADMLNQYYGFK